MALSTEAKSDLRSEVDLRIFKIFGRMQTFAVAVFISFCDFCVQWPVSFKRTSCFLFNYVIKTTHNALNLEYGATTMKQW